MACGLAAEDLSARGRSSQETHGTRRRAPPTCSSRSPMQTNRHRRAGAPAETLRACPRRTACQPAHPAAHQADLIATTKRTKQPAPCRACNCPHRRLHPRATGPIWNVHQSARTAAGTCSAPIGLRPPFRPSPTCWLHRLPMTHGPRLSPRHAHVSYPCLQNYRWRTIPAHVHPQNQRWSRD